MLTFKPWIDAERGLACLERKVNDLAREERGCRDSTQLTCSTRLGGHTVDVQPLRRNYLSQIHTISQGCVTSEFE